MQINRNATISKCVVVRPVSPARRCPTTSARLPFLTLVMKAPSLPISVIFPPTTCKQKRHGHQQRVMFGGIFPLRQTTGFLNRNHSLLTFRPRREPASRGMADLLLSVMRPIRWSPSLDGCHVTGCCRRSYRESRTERRKKKTEGGCDNVTEKRHFTSLTSSHLTDTYMPHCRI